jgi:hypothetical protein
MKNIRVGHSMEATVNTGDFSNVKPGYSISAEVEEGESPSEVKKRLHTVVEKWMNEELSEIQRDLAAK